MHSPLGPDLAHAPGSSAGAAQRRDGRLPAFEAPPGHGPARGPSSHAPALGARRRCEARGRGAPVKIRLLALGTRMPAWVEQGYRDYARRLRAGWSLELAEIAAAKRTRRAPLARLVEEEGDRLLAALPSRANVVALDEAGTALSSADLARHLADWQQSGLALALMVGGPDGLSARCLERASFRWSLSRLTLPHALVRVLVAEQIYRAWSMLHRHPYHRR